MRFNSAFTGFLNNRLLVASRIAIVMLIIFFIGSSFRKHSDPDLRAKQVNLIIRQIGHRLLLQAGDSTSRVLPVTKIKEGTFVLKFENKFVFNHDSLMVLSKGLLSKTQFPSGYTVTVHDCRKGGIVYGFQLNNTSPDILACSGRSEPAGCYTIEFTFPDFYKDREQKKAHTDKLNKSNNDPQNVALQLDKFQTPSLDYNINQQIESAKVDAKEISPALEKSKKKTADYPQGIVVFGGMLLLLGVGLLIGRLGKNLKTVPLQNEDHSIEELVPEGSALGKFLFDVKNQRLLLGSEVTSLTDKECQVLDLLHKNFSELIPRETLMQKVWIDEGVITGRSLDMFISKLRKKLSVDPDLRITNIHGKGYRLEIVNDFLA